MTAVSAWEQDNARFLSAALTWLRALLAERLPEEERDGAADGSVAAARAAMRAAEQAADPPPALTVLADRLGLSTFERDTLLLSAAPMLDTRVGALCARLQGDPARAYPCLALALTLFDDPSWLAVTPHGALRRLHLTEVVTDGAEPVINGRLVADERIVGYLKGLNLLDIRVLRLLVPIDSGVAALDLAPSQETVAERTAERLRRIGAAEPLPRVRLLGPDPSSRHLVAAATADRLGLALYRLPRRLTPGPAELETFVRVWDRECLLLPVALLVDGPGPDADPHADAAERLAETVGGLVFLDGGGTASGHRSITAEVARPSAAEQHDAWAATVGAGAAAELAGQFDLSLGDIRRTAAEEKDQDRIWSACVAAARPRVDRLAERLDAKATWDDLVLPDAELAALRRMTGQVSRRTTVYDDWGFRQVMNRGFGVTALFSGPSGTGKTMAAEVLAGQLRLELYRVDLSAVVSKYIGETEKNLGTLFDQMDSGGALLLFDEADALFGKRTEVRDSHDRYANLEVNYLLQRMESYRGLAVLATNRKDALDRAFLRRLRFVVDFPFPGHEQRERIWTRAFPAGVPVAGLDRSRLARFKLSGGGIHAAALNAAFEASALGSPVTMPVVLAAVEAELRKLQLPVSAADLVWPPADRSSG